MSESPTQPKPYIAPERNIPEATVLAVGLGIILAIVLGAANVYLGLYAGMTVSASIPAAVVSMAVLRGIFRRGTILENNIAQTIASTGESLAAGAIFTIPALVMVGAWQNFELWPTTFIIMLGGLLGVVFMVPLRRALIVERPDLTYPEGVACSEVLIAGQEGGSGLRSIAIGLGIGAIFKFLVSGVGIVKGTVEGAVAMGRSVFYAGSDMSVALVAVGYIVNLRIASQVFLGGAIGWILVLPLLRGFEAGVDPLELTGELYSLHIRYIGVGTMLVGGLHSIWTVRKGIFGGLASLRGVSTDTTGEILRTERDIPLTALMSIFFITVLGTFALYEYLIPSHTAAAVATVMMVVASFIFVAVATYIVGLVGSSNSPVSGMTICALLMTAGVLMALGIKGDSAILATLGVAGVVCCAACTSGDIAQDLKTGLLVGATPARQQWTEFIGVLVPAFVFAPVMSLLHNAYVIGEGLRAPQAALFASLTQGFFGDGTLPRNMLLVGVVIGAAIIVADTFLQRAGARMRLHIMPIAVGIYLPLALSVPIFIGGLLRAFTGGRGKSDAQDSGILFGSGLIAGEALMGIGLAAFVSLKWFPLLEDGYVWVSLALFAAILYLYARFARSRGSQPDRPASD